MHWRSLVVQTKVEPWRRWGQQCKYVSGNWHSSRHMCVFNNLLSLINEAGTTCLLTLSLAINISLLYFPPTTTLLPSSFSFFSSSTHHPSLFFPLYGWVVIFPWDSGGGELSRACYFIFPNKAGNMFRPPHPGFTEETFWQKLRHDLLFTHSLCLQYNAVLHTRWLSLHRLLILLFMTL